MVSGLLLRRVFRLRIRGLWGSPRKLISMRRERKVIEVLESHLGTSEDNLEMDNAVDSSRDRFGVV